MTTTISSSEGGRFLPVYRLALRRNAGYFGLASLLIFLFYPLQYLMEVFKKIPPDFWMNADPNLPQDPYAPYYLYGLGRNFTDVSMVLFTAVFLLLPFLLALMLNSYMHSKKAADVYHALPIRREVLMGVNAAVAMTIVTVPLVISNVIVLAASAAKFGPSVYMGFQLLDMVCWLACAFLIYAVTTLVCTQVGTVFDTFLFTGVVLFILPVLTGVFVMMGQIFLYGFTVPDDLLHAALMLSPVLYPVDRLSYLYNTYMFGTSMNQQTELDTFSKFIPVSNAVMVIYLVLGAVLLLAAMRLYVRRHSEQAETTTSKGVLATAVQFIGTLLGGIAGGMLFYSIGRGQSKPVYFLWCAVGCLVSFAVLEVILNRGFKTLRRRAPAGGIMMAVTLALSGIMMTGGLGYEKRLPDAEKLDAVELNWVGGYETMGEDLLREQNGQRVTVELTTQEAMKAVIDYQKAAAAEQFDRNAEELEAAGKNRAYAYMNIEYKKAGLPMLRSYRAVSTDTLSRLIPLELSEEFQKQANPFFSIGAENVVSWNISNALGWDNQQVKLSREDSQRLLEAIRADSLILDPEKALHPEDKIAAHLAAGVFVPRNERGMARARAESVYYLSDITGSYRYYDGSGDIYEAYTPVSGPETKRVLADLNLLPEEPDLSRCIGAHVSNSQFSPSPGRTGHSISVSDSMIARENRMRNSGEKAYLEAKAETERARNEDYDYQRRYEAGLRELYVEDPEKLAALARSAVPSWKADEPLLQVTFFQKEDGGQRYLLVPLSKLPVPMQEEFDPAPIQPES